MAITLENQKKYNSNLSIEELEHVYKTNYYFEKKEDEIEYIIDSYRFIHKIKMIPKSVIEELIAEKTNKPCTLKEKHYDLNLENFIYYLFLKEDPTYLYTFIDFFSKLKNVDEKEKITFLLRLNALRESFDTSKTFHEFLWKLTPTNTEEIYNLYKRIVDNEYLLHKPIG